MRRVSKSSEPGPIIIVQQIQKHDWIMELPRLTEEVQDRLHEGIDSMEVDPDHAASI
jgi:hypothetical protein